MSEPPAKPAASELCPICGRRGDPALLPFCSKRCANVDLGRWFSESYRVPSRRDPEAEDPDEVG